MIEPADMTVAPVPVLEPLTLTPLVDADEGFPTFGSGRLTEMASYVADRLGVGGVEAVGIDPPTADERPGRKVSVGGVAVCRAVGDASDPRPFSAVVLGLIRSAAAAQVEAV